MLTLQDKNNVSFKGILRFHSDLGHQDASNPTQDLTNITNSVQNDYDEAGAGFYVIAVILVYAMSIVALIASHIKKKQKKLTEDKQIDKYVDDFQIVKEKQARDSYRNLKKSIMTRINWDKQKRKPTHKTIHKSIFPVLAIGLPGSHVAEESPSDSLSNVDLAAAEQYMIAKDRGRLSGRRKKNLLTLAYFNALRRVSRKERVEKLCRNRRSSLVAGLSQLISKPRNPRNVQNGEDNGMNPSSNAHLKDINEHNDIMLTDNSPNINSDNLQLQSINHQHNIEYLEEITPLLPVSSPSGNTSITLSPDTEANLLHGSLPNHLLDPYGVWLTNPGSPLRSSTPTLEDLCHPYQECSSHEGSPVISRSPSASAPISPATSPGHLTPATSPGYLSPSSAKSYHYKGSTEELIQITSL